LLEFLDDAQVAVGQVEPVDHLGLGQPDDVERVAGGELAVRERQLVEPEDLIGRSEADVCPRDELAVRRCGEGGLGPDEVVDRVTAACCHPGPDGYAERARHALPAGFVDGVGDLDAEVDRGQPVLVLAELERGDRPGVLRDCARVRGCGAQIGDDLVECQERITGAARLRVEHGDDEPGTHDRVVRHARSFPGQRCST